MEHSFLLPVLYPYFPVFCYFLRSRSSPSAHPFIIDCITFKAELGYFCPTNTSNHLRFQLLTKSSHSTVHHSDQYRKVTMLYKRIGYNINVMRQSACLVINPITVDSFASVFNCSPAGRASDSMKGPTKSFMIYLSWLGLDIFLSVGHLGFKKWFCFAPVIQWFCFTPWGSPGVTIRFCRVLISYSS